MFRKIGIGFIATATVASLGLGAWAMPIHFEDMSFSAEATQLIDGEPYTLTATDFQLLGSGDEEGVYLVFFDGNFLKVSADDLAGVFDAIGGAAVAELPAQSDYQPMARRTQGDEVTRFQEKLIALGYMEEDATADGYFGGQSQRAVSAMQKALGLEETGEADPLLQMLIDSMSAQTIDVSSASGQEKGERSSFTEISGKTDANLDAAEDLGLLLTYDDISGKGMITKGDAIEYNAPAQSDIDRRAFQLTFGLSAVENAEGLITVTPVLRAVSTGVQRPVMREVILKSGEERQNLLIESLENTASGLNAIETAQIALNAGAVELLANAADVGELKIRVNCKYGEYDIPLTDSQIQTIAQIGQAALGLGE